MRLSVNFDKYFAYDVIDATGENQRDKTAGYLSARLLDTFRPAERWELTGGAEYNYEDIFSASLFGDAPTTKTIQDANLFAQAEYDPIRNLDIIAGARYTYNDAFGSSFNPKLSVMYSVAGFNFRGGIGTAFRAPSVEELYYDFYHTGGGGFMVYGNPDLKAERGLYLLPLCRIHLPHVERLPVGLLQQHRQQDRPVHRHAERERHRRGEPLLPEHQQRDPCGDST